MTTLLRVTPNGPAWPYSDSRLRQEEPSVLFPPTLSAEDRALFNVFEPMATPPPEHDAAIERVVETFPELIAGQWLQRWEIVPLTPAEIAAREAENRPQPEWVEFGSTVTRLPQINALLTTALSAGASALAFALAVGLGKAADGKPEVFLDAWAGVKTAGLVPAELTPPLQALATQHHLPQEFVEAL